MGEGMSFLLGQRNDGDEGRGKEICTVNSIIMFNKKYGWHIFAILTMLYLVTTCLS